jgi:hypothetical protein
MNAAWPLDALASTGRFTPVIKLASLLARKATTPAISPAVRSVPAECGQVAAPAVLEIGSKAGMFMGVKVTLGLTASSMRYCR